MRLNIYQYIKFWTKQSVHQDKGGSFNLDLYIRYLQVISSK